MDKIILNFVLNILMMNEILRNLKEPVINREKKLTF